MWNAFVIVFPFKIRSRSANPDLRVIVVLGLCCIVRNRAAESCVMPSLLNRCVRAQIPQFDKKTKGRNRKYRSFASFLFLKLFEGWNNEEHRSMNEQKASWMSAEKLSFSTFPSEPGRWTCRIFIHAAFYSAKQKERKMGWYREIVEEVIYYYFFILCPLTLPHYHSLCWRRDRNGALWAKEWPIHPFHNIRLHKRYCYIFLSFVEMFAASLLYLLTFRREVRHVLLSFTWHLLFLSTRVDLWNRIPMVKENPENIRKISNFDFQAWKIDFKAEYIYFF